MEFNTPRVIYRISFTVIVAVMRVRFFLHFSDLATLESRKGVGSAGIKPVWNREWKYPTKQESPATSTSIGGATAVKPELKFTALLHHAATSLGRRTAGVFL